jgi:hypothetical protein
MVVASGNGNIVNVGIYPFGSGTTHMYTSINATRIA